MIRTLLATTALATLVATGAYAQTAPAPAAPAEQTETQVKHADGHLASNIIGQTVYNSSGDDGENIGSVTDLVISPDGDVEAIVVGVGGFLGIGRKDVALEYDVAEWAERDGKEWLVIPTNREALEALPEFDRAAFSPQSASAEVGNTTPASGQDVGVAAAPAAVGTATPAKDNVAKAPADGTKTAAVDRSTLTEVTAGSMSADDFIGTTVYGANDENVGSIDDVILSQDGKVEAVIIDVGGFLGIGSKAVAVDLDNLTFMTDADGDHYLYTSLTEEQLKAQPEYDESSYAANRQGQLLVVPAK